MKKIIDLTRTLRPGMHGVEFEQKYTVADKGWNARTLHLYSHCGTHADAPIHVETSNRTIDQIELDPEQHKTISEKERRYILENRQQVSSSASESRKLSLTALFGSRNMWLAMGQYFCSNFTFFICYSAGFSISKSLGRFSHSILFSRCRFKCAGCFLLANEKA